MAKEKRHYATDEEIAELMAKNGWSKDEAEYYLIDKYDEVVFPDETDEVIEKAKENLKVANVYDNKKGKRVRTLKPDEDKRAIVAVIKNAINELFHNAVVVNEERQIDFKLNGFDYSITVTKHRKK
jgi:phosphoribosylformylglycinamidine (FGAM) synthase PurS component